jgi:hypothetical protein
VRKAGLEPASLAALAPKANQMCFTECRGACLRDLIGGGVSPSLPGFRKTVTRIVTVLPLKRKSDPALGRNGEKTTPVHIFVFFAYTVRVFNLPHSRRCEFAIRCKGCGETIPAPVGTMPDSWIVADCPLCGSKRRYLPTEIFRGSLSHSLRSLRV